MSKSIGHGKNWKKRKTAKNWQKTSRFRKKLVNKLFSRRIFSFKVSWSNSELKMTSIWNLSKNRTITLRISSNLCKDNSLIWEWTTVTSSIKLRQASCKSAKKFWIVTIKPSKICSNFAGLRKRSTHLTSARCKKRIIKNSNNWKLKMPTTKLSKKLSLKRKCKFFRNVWRTWKLFSDSMRKNLNSITTFLDKEKEWMKKKSLSLSKH